MRRVVVPRDYCVADMIFGLQESTLFEVDGMPGTRWLEDAIIACARIIASWKISGEARFACKSCSLAVGRQ